LGGKIFENWRGGGRKKATTATPRRQSPQPFSPSVDNRDPSSLRRGGGTRKNRLEDFTGGPLFGGQGASFSHNHQKRTEEEVKRLDSEKTPTKGNSSSGEKGRSCQASQKGENQGGGDREVRAIFKRKGSISEEKKESRGGVGAKREKRK